MLSGMDGHTVFTLALQLLGTQEYKKDSPTQHPCDVWFNPVQAPLDAGLARLFGSGNGMTVEDWKELLRGAADPDLCFQMLMFGVVVEGMQPGMAEGENEALPEAGYERGGSFRVLGGDGYDGPLVLHAGYYGGFPGAVATTGGGREPGGESGEG